MSAARDQFIASVLQNVALCREHYQLDLVVRGFPPTEPGQFVQLLCRPVDGSGAVDHEIDWHADTRPWHADDPELLAPLAVLRRPFSLAGRMDRDDGASVLRIIHRVVGIGTAWLAQLQPGAEIGVLGPLGNSFALPEPGQAAILVGGGVGIPPMLYLAGALAGRARAVAFCGATTADLLPLTVTAPIDDSVKPDLNIAEFARHGVSSVITTDDGSCGFRGFVTQALERYLDEANLRGREAVIYTCGPEAMMKRVADIAITRGIPCQVAVERAMACGMGTCQSCCILVKKPDVTRPPLPGRDWCYRLACTDGPIFAASELLW